MGAMLAGSCTDVVKQLLPVYNAPGCCTLVGLKGTVSANNAAFLNGISGHELELDDTSSSNLGHPTVAVLPSVLAVGEERASSGEEVLKAFILATEVECKIGRICAAELHRRGWHASSITGVLGAAAGAGYLYGQDSTAMRNTLGIAASMASGVRENFGTSTKSVHIGKTAGDGVLAAQMASHASPPPPPRWRDTRAICGNTPGLTASPSGTISPGRWARPTICALPALPSSCTPRAAAPTALSTP